MMSSDKSVINFYNSSHLKRRSIAALLWSVALLPLCLYLTSTAASFQPFAFQTWLAKCFWQVVSFKYWIYSLLVIISALPLISQNMNRFSALPSIYTRRIDSYLFFLHPSVMILSMCYFLFSLVTSLVILSLTHHHQELSGNPSEIGSWNYLTVFATSLMLSYYLPFHFCQKRDYQFKFPLIYLPKLTRAKLCLRKLLASSLKNSVVLSASIYLINQFLIFPQARNSSVWKIFMDEATVEESLFSLNLQLLYQHFVIVFSVYFLSGIHLILYNIFHTQPIEFPVIAKCATDSNRCLANALSCKEHPLLQHLAFLDLFRLAQCDRKRRMEIFSLSNPGYHPVYWQAIIEECLRQLDSYVVTLSSHAYSTLDGNSAAATSEDKFKLQGLQTTSRSRTSSGNGTILPSSSSSPHKSSPSLASPPFLYSTLTTPPRSARLRSATAALSPQVDGAFLSATNQHGRNHASHPKVDSLPNIFDKLSKAIKQSQPMSYFFGEIVERKNGKLLQDAQKHIWLVQSISLLALHSYEGDNHGVVQGHLSQMLASLLSLHEILGKPWPLSVPGKKCNSVESRLKTLLKSETKSAIYQIVVTFKDSLCSMTSPPELLHKLNSFRVFRE